MADDRAWELRGRKIIGHPRREEKRLPVACAT